MPLPKLQLSTLCLVRLAEPVAFTQIFPYINQFIALFVADDASVPFYSGVVESAFALAQLSSIYQWARLSDVIGRKPVIVTGVLGLALATLLFGVSRSLSEIIISRCLAGLFSGTVATLHSVLGELTDDTNQSIAFPIYGLVWPLGVILGPLIGGTLSNINPNLPIPFILPFLHQYPYFLPCAVSAAIALIAALVGWGVLDETLPAKRMLRSEYTRAANIQVHEPIVPPRNYGATDLAGSSCPTLSPPQVHLVDSQPQEERGLLTPSTSLGARPSIKQLLAIPIIRALCLSGFALSFVATAFDVVFVLFCYSSVDDGGLGFSANQIGLSLSLAGIISISIQVLVLPYLLACNSSRENGRGMTLARVYTICMWMWVWAFVGFVGVGFIARVSCGGGGGGGMMVWLGVAVVLILSRIGCLAYSIAMILVKEHAPREALGSANGLTQFTQCLARAIAPAFVSSAFALSHGNGHGSSPSHWLLGLLGEYAWVWVMVGICVVGCWFSRMWMGSS